MKYLPVATILLGSVLPSAADYVVDLDLGILPVGDKALAGTTGFSLIDPGPPEIFGGGNNNSVFPKGIFAQGPNLNWGSEIVFQFEILQPSVISITQNAVFTNDPDFFLLDGLATSIDLQSGKISADNAIAAAVLDFGPPETEEFPSLQPGIYYLAVESYIGQDGSVTPRDATFDVTLTVEPATAFDFPVELGHIAREGTPFTLDTFGSLFNTELAVYDAFTETLVAENDDAGGGLQSELEFPAGLPSGGYYAVIVGFDSTFDPGGLTVSSGGETGDWTLNFPLGPTFGPGVETGFTDPSFEATEVQTFFFSINAAPFEPIDLGTIAAEDEPFGIDTIGSTSSVIPGPMDTQIGLFDSEGFLLAFNDDIDFGSGNYLSELFFDLGLPAGEYFLALGGYPNFFGDGFFVVVDTRISNSTDGGNFVVNHPNGSETGPLAQGTQEWFTFNISGGPSLPDGIAITDISYDPATNEFTVSWESNVAGPFNIFVGNGTDLAALGAPPANVLPILGKADAVSPQTFTNPLESTEAQVFLQVTD